MYRIEGYPSRESKGMGRDQRMGIRGKEDQQLLKSGGNLVQLLLGVGMNAGKLIFINGLYLEEGNEGNYSNERVGRMGGKSNGMENHEFDFWDWDVGKHLKSSELGTGIGEGKVLLELVKSDEGLVVGDVLGL